MTDAKPIPMPRRETDTSGLLLSDTPDDARPVGELEVRPRRQERVSLGNFTLANPPKGFSLQVTPKRDSDAVVPQLTRLGATYDKYELVLHVANYGDRTVSVEVFAA